MNSIELKFNEKLLNLLKNRIKFVGTTDEAPEYYKYWEE